MITKKTKDLFLAKYSNIGRDRFYKFLIIYAIEKIANIKETKISPESELMNYHDNFLQLYRRENDIIYLDIARQFRKAAHKIYRMMLKKDLIDKSNRFLNLVNKCQ